MLLKPYLYTTIFFYNIRIIITQLFYGKKFKKQEELLSDLKLAFKIDKAIYRNKNNSYSLKDLRKYSFVEHKELSDVPKEPKGKLPHLKIPNVKSVKMNTDKALNKPIIKNVPLQKPTVSKKKNKLIELNKQLDILLDEEKYEEASKVRDQIEELKNNQKSE